MQPPFRVPPVVLCLLGCVALAGCAAASEAEDAIPTGRGGGGAPHAELHAPEKEPPVISAEEPAAAEPLPQAEGIAARPAWLGTRILPLRADGFGEIQPTPPELEDRRLPPPPDGLPPPAGAEYAASVQAVPDEVAQRSTWAPHCPVAREDLRYVTVSFWGFDERPHTGELLVHERVADAMVEVFRRIYDARFPIEEMRVITPAELDAPPTGDGNTTTAFVCRPTVTSGSWSQHAYGLAVDINPFHNPYLKGDIVVPELASAYLDRDRHRPGMIQPGDVVTRAFAGLGWPWGGNWSSAKDWMHFSHNGR